MSKQNDSKQTREEKKAQFSRTKPKKSRTKAITVTALMAVAALGIYFIVKHKPGSTALTASSADANGYIAIPISAISDGKARFFDYTSADSTNVRFFVMRSSDGVCRAALDACDTCFHAKKGYHEEGDEMVCNNCGLRFPSIRINEVSGGCNPVGLPVVIESDTIRIKTAEFESRKSYF